MIKTSTNYHDKIINLFKKLIFVEKKKKINIEKNLYIYIYIYIYIYSLYTGVD